MAEPKHKQAAKHCTDTAATMSSLNEFLKEKAVMDRERLVMAREREECLEAEARVKREQVVTKERLDMAKTVLSMEGASAEAKAAANKYILTLFQF